MKSVVLTMGSVLALILNAAGSSAEEMALYKAREHGTLARERLYIVDQDGIPVAGAKTREDV